MLKVLQIEHDVINCFIMQKQDSNMSKGDLKVLTNKVIRNQFQDYYIKTHVALIYIQQTAGMTRS